MESPNHQRSGTQLRPVHIHAGTTNTQHRQAVAQAALIISVHLRCMAAVQHIFLDFALYFLRVALVLLLELHNVDLTFI